GMDRAAVIALTTHQVDRVLAELVDSCDHARIGLVVALEHDHVGKFGGDVDVRAFQGAAHDRAAAACVWHADGRSRTSGAELEVVVPHRHHGVRIANGGHSHLADRNLAAVGV